MLTHGVISYLFLIFAGTALVSTLALLTRQSMLVAYILVGMVLGPWGLAYVHDSSFISQVGDIGIIFLLFLLGLNLPPQKLWKMLQKISWVGCASSLLFAIPGYIIPWMFGFGHTVSWVVALCMMFSSTIIGIKLLPTTILHHQHTGEVMISVLLFQDLIAILVLLLVDGISSGHAVGLRDIGLLVAGMLGLLVVAYVAEQFVLVKLFAKFDRIHEYLFLLAIAWCLAMAELAGYIGLSADVGAFIAGVSLAASPISFYIADSLRPLRDFFLVMFFFAVGAGFNFSNLAHVVLPALLLAAVALLFKPVVYKMLLRQVGETKQVAWEVGVRLAQISEFSLIIIYAAMHSGLVTGLASDLVQAATIITFVFSCYIVVLKYPTPMALTDRMRQD